MEEEHRSPTADLSGVGSEGRLLLAMLAESSEPIGARRATSTFLKAGVGISESSVSRLLRRLDHGGLTRAVGSKGRVLTHNGRQALVQLEFERRSVSGLVRAADIRNLDDLLDLLVARRGVEREAVRGAAVHSTRDQISELTRVIDEQAKLIASNSPSISSALEFHRTIGRASDNRVLSALVETLFDPGFDVIESVLDLVTERHHSESVSIAEHREIIKSIEARDENLAEQAMQNHIDRLILEVRAFEDAGRAGMFERALRWMRQQE